MKFSIHRLLLVALTFSSSHSKGLRSKQGRKLELSKEALDTIKREYMLTDGVDLTMHSVSPSNTVTLDGKEYSLSGLEEFSVLAPDFESMVDGVKVEPTATTLMSTGTTEDGALITVMQDDMGNIEFIQIQDGDYETTLISVTKLGYTPGTFVAISDNDYDFDTLGSLFNFEGDDMDSNMEVDTKEEGTVNQDLRHLQTCTDFANFADSLGDTCANYAENNWCQEYGSDFANKDGQTANMACCACGGGTKTAPAPAPAPTPSGPAGTCVDTPFLDDEKYNCPKYENPNYWCKQYGDVANAKGETPNKACCACGGGTKSAPPAVPAPVPGKCTSFKTMDVAIAYDSSFCAAHGGTGGGAQKRIEEIVASAKGHFEVPGLCASIRIAAIEGYCDAAKDEYRDIQGQENLLDLFTKKWKNDNNRLAKPYAAVHLFTQTKFSQRSTIGVAYTKGICAKYSRYGVNWMGYNSGIVPQGWLFAHELAHNAGTGHDDPEVGKGFIMHPSDSDGSKGFSEASKNNMSTWFAETYAYCIVAQPIA